MDKRILYTPFVFIAGAKALLIGVMGLLATSYLAFYTGTHFNGLFIAFAKDSDFWVYGVENVLYWIILSTLLYIAGLIFSTSRIRIIDVFGTIAFSRLPLLITPALRTIPVFQSFLAYSINFYVLIAVYVISVIWAVTLSFNAFKISCNLKNEKLTVTFIICMILSEGLTKLFLYILI